MEPIIIILLLFGAFTLGAEMGDRPEAKISESITEQQPEKPAEKAVPLSLEACQSDRQSVIYRDLTLPVSSNPTSMPSSHQPETENSDD